MLLNRHRRFLRWIDCDFVGELPSHKKQQLFSHLGSCESCRNTYNRLGYVRRTMLPNDPLGGAGENLAPAASEKLAPTIAEPARPRLRVAFVGTVSAAAVAALLFVLRPDAVDYFRARGTAPQFAGRPPGATLFCVSPPSHPAALPQVKASVIANSSQKLAPTLGCQLSDELQIAYSTPDGLALTLQVQGTGPTGITHYAPSGPSDPPIALKPGVVDEPLPFSTRLSVKHRAGTVDLEVRFDQGTRKVARLFVRLELIP